MKKSLAAIVCIACSLNVSAISTTVSSAHMSANAAATAARTATMAATRGAISPSKASQDPDRRMLAVCFWQVPKKQQWINIGALQEITVVPGGGNSYVFVLKVDRYQEYRIDLPMGMDVSELPNKVFARLNECSGKE